MSEKMARSNLVGALFGAGIDFAVAESTADRVLRRRSTGNLNDEARMALRLSALSLMVQDLTHVMLTSDIDVIRKFAEDARSKASLRASRDEAEDSSMKRHGALIDILRFARDNANRADIALRESGSNPPPDGWTPQDVAEYHAKCFGKAHEASKVLIAIAYCAARTLIPGYEEGKLSASDIIARLLGGT